MKAAYVLQAQNGAYYVRHERLGYRVYTPEITHARQFPRYVDAFNARSLSDRVIEVEAIEH